MSTLTLNIAGTNYSPNIDSINAGDIIEQRSQCKFVIQTDLTVTFSFGQRVTVTDSVLGVIFYGIVNTDDYHRLDPQDILEHDIDCIDCTFDVDRLTSNEVYTAQYAGVIVADQHKKHLAAEGITAAYALDIDTAQTDFAAGTLSNTVATTTMSGDGCLQLAAAGSKVVVSGQSASSQQVNGLLFTGYASSGYQNAYTYRQMWGGSQSISSGDYLQYDIWIADTSPMIKAGVDFMLSDGTDLRDSGAVDQQGMSAHPNTDLSGLANNQWYTRIISMPGALYGKTINGVTLSFEGDNAGTYTAYFKHIIYVPSGGGTVFFFGNASTLSTNNQTLNSGYSNVSLTQVSVSSSPVTVTHPSLSISAANIVRDSLITYASSIPSGCTGIMQTSIDNGATWQNHTSGNPIPNLLPGMSVSGRSLLYQHILTLGKDPTAIISFGAPKVTVDTSYNATKSDVIYAPQTATDFNAGSYSNLQAVGGSDGITINGYQRNWDNADYSNQTFYGYGSQYVVNKQFVLQSLGASGNNARSRLDFLGQWQNFTLETDISYYAAWQTGIVYRTTGWANNEDFAYAIMFAATQLTFGHGTNTSSAGTYTPIQNANIFLNDNTVHRLKLVINGNNHKAYLDGILLINVNDSTFTGSGYIGFRVSNGTGVTQTTAFDNFGICSALSGTWQSPSTSISAATTYGNSVVSWDTNAIPNGCGVSAQTSIDGGSTWQTATNGGPIGGLTAGQSLAAKNLLVKMTLAAANADVVPVLNGLSAWIIGQFSASGTRISPVLSLASAVRAGATITAWNALTPTNTSLVIATSPTGSGSWTNVNSGDPIAGITAQSIPLFDTFSVNSSANYTSTHRTGGVNGTFVFDTTNSRVSVSGGTNAALLYTTTSKKDVDVMLDLDQADQAGLVWRWVDANNFYELDIADASASSAANTAKLYKVVANVKTQLGSTAVISLTRGTPHRLRITNISTAIVVTLDGNSIISVTDSSITSAGQVGLFSGTGIGRFYNFRILALGDDLSASSAYTRTTFTSNDPTVTPQLLDLTLCALSPDIGIGALIPNGDYRNVQTNKTLDAVVSASPISYWFVRPDKSLVARPRQADPAPWILTGDDTLIVTPPHVSNNGDHYRNREVITNVSSTVAFTDRQTGDGQTRTWTLKFSLVSAPVVLLNGQAVVIGLKGTSGSDFYYEVGSPTLTQDNAGTILQPNIDFLDIAATGQTTTTVQRDNTGAFPGTVSQSQFATITGGGTGIVADVQDGTGMTVAQAQVFGDGLLQEFGVIGRTFQFKTERTGLKAGQYLSAINQKLLLNDAALLITKVAMSYWTSASGSTMQFQAEASEGPNVGSWQKVIESSLQS